METVTTIVNAPVTWQAVLSIMEHVSFPILPFGALVLADVVFILAWGRALLVFTLLSGVGRNAPLQITSSCTPWENLSFNKI